jgi:hypothetical protein
MAIYHLTAKTVSRGTVTAKARYDYIEREGRYASDKAEVEYSQSGNMPEWANDARKYWDSADVYERGNGRLFKQLEFALPKELTPDQQKELVQGYVDKLTTVQSGPLPYSFAIHKGHDKENPHCHLLLSERVNDGHTRSPETWFKRANSKEPERGGAKKTTDLMPKEWLQEARREWGQQANKALEKAGYEARIDHRSLEAQGIERKPTRHLGPTAAAMERKGIATDRGKLDVDQGESDQAKKIALGKELEAAKRQREEIQGGISQARERFAAEKERRQQEAERERQAECQRQEAKEREKEAQREKEKQATLERLQEQRQKSRGMGFSR